MRTGARRDRVTVPTRRTLRRRAELPGPTRPAEVRQRAEAVLRRLELGDGPPPAAYLRTVRAVEVLERIGSAEAAAVLKDWAGSDRSGVRRTEAKAAIARLTVERSRPRPE